MNNRRLRCIRTEEHTFFGTYRGERAVNHKSLLQGIDVDVELVTGDPIPVGTEFVLSIDQVEVTP